MFWRLISSIIRVLLFLFDLFTFTSMVFDFSFPPYCCIFLLHSGLPANQHLWIILLFSTMFTWLFVQSPSLTTQISTNFFLILFWRFFSLDSFVFSQYLKSTGYWTLTNKLIIYLYESFSSMNIGVLLSFFLDCFFMKHPYEHHLFHF